MPNYYTVKFYILVLKTLRYIVIALYLPTNIPKFRRATLENQIDLNSFIEKLEDDYKSALTMEDPK